MQTFEIIESIFRIQCSRDLKWNKDYLFDINLPSKQIFGTHIIGDSKKKKGIGALKY